MDNNNTVITAARAAAAAFGEANAADALAEAGDTARAAHDAYTEALRRKART